MDAMLSTPHYEDLERDTITYMGTCVEDSASNLNYNAMLPEPTMDEIYQSDTTGSVSDPGKNPPNILTNQADWNNWRSTEDAPTEAAPARGQTSQFEAMSPAATSPYDVNEEDSDQVKSLKFELKAAQKKRDLFQTQYWRLRAEVIWLLSALRHEMDLRRDAAVELMTLQFNQQIEEMNKRHLQDVVIHAKRQHGKLIEELQREKNLKESSEVEKSSRKVLEETIL